MAARLIERSRTEIDDTTFFEIVVWRLPSPVPGSAHLYKYRFALVMNGECALRYDNERGKGDHRHMGNHEDAIEFTTIEALFDAFHADMERMLK